MYIHNNKIHSFQHFHNSVQSCHDFVNSIVRRLPSPDHDWAPSNGTIGYSVSKAVNGKRDALVHEVVQVDGAAKNFHHHTFRPFFRHSPRVKT